MHLSPLMVYFVLQLDSIRDSIEATPILIALLFGILRFFSLIVHNVTPEDEKEKAEARLQKCWSWSRIAIIFAVGMLAGALIPSTKTAAGMLIAPAIVNSSVVQADIPELYSLGVSRLKEALAPSK